MSWDTLITIHSFMNAPVFGAETTKCSIGEEEGVTRDTMLLSQTKPRIPPCITYSRWDTIATAHTCYVRAGTLLGLALFLQQKRPVVSRRVVCPQRIRK